MTLTRRSFITSTAAAAGLVGTGTTLWANAALDLGGLTIDTLSDGHLTLPKEFFVGHLDPAQYGPVMSEFGLAETAMFESPCNVTLLRDGTNTILFDVGSGPDFMPTAGKLVDALDALGVAPDDVTHVVFTHAHPDHIWGLLDDFDDPLFYDATYMMGRAEYEYWADPNTVDTIGTDRQTFAVGAARRLDAIADQIELFDDGQEILPGVAARATHGHTPGHMSFEVRKGSESVMIVGDAIANPHLGFMRPDLSSGSDQDRDLGVKTRLSLLDQMAADQMRLIGYHMPTPGIGRAERRKDGGYTFVADAG